MTGLDVLPEKELFEKAATIKRFEYSPLGKELKKQTSVAEKQYQNFDNVFESDKIQEDKTKSRKSRTKSNLVYSNYFTFYKLHDINDFVKRSLDSKIDRLKEFKDKFESFYHDTIEIKPKNKEQKKDLKEENLWF